MTEPMNGAASTPVEQSNRLPVLIEEIKQFEVLGHKQGRAALMTRLDEGDRLRELKDSVEHGRWLPLLEELGIHEMKARRYMKLAAHRALVEAKSDLESDFGLTDALNYIRDFEEQKQREADKEYQARKREREERNRELLAAGQESKARHDAEIKREADAERERELGEASCPAPKALPLPVAQAMLNFAHYVQHFLERVGPDQHAEFFKQARGILDSMEAQHRPHMAAPETAPTGVEGRGRGGGCGRGRAAGR
jgi:hypothetical protein